MEAACMNGMITPHIYLFFIKYAGQQVRPATVNQVCVNSNTRPGARLVRTDQEALDAVIKVIEMDGIRSFLEGESEVMP
jgi:hypothetical protein